MKARKLTSGQKLCGKIEIRKSMLSCKLFFGRISEV